ncbi:MAG: hypothetical protein GY717_20515 [Rhodobacteraceae bacterium]|nr:hypothetical protein [Paracoccaceae bacterium]
MAMFEHDLTPRRARRNIERNKTMMWLIEIWMAGFFTTQGINAVFATLMLAAAMGADARLAAALSAALYLALVFV